MQHELIPTGWPGRCVKRTPCRRVARRLSDHPEYHDKLEFEIINTCADFTFEQTFRERYGNTLNGDAWLAYSGNLKRLTARMVDARPAGSLAWRTGIGRSTRRSENYVDQCSEGSLQLFAKFAACLARRAMAAVLCGGAARFTVEIFLRAAVHKGALSEERYEAFGFSLETVLSDLSADMHDVISGKRDEKDFLSIYGHLRPGTYDILSPKYADRSDLFVGSNLIETHKKKAFVLSVTEETALNSLFEEIGYAEVDAHAFMDYARRSVAAREALKFRFSWFLSKSIDAIAAWGECVGLGRDDLSFLTLSDILCMQVSPVMRDPATIVNETVQNNRSEWFQCDALKLGHFIASVDDIYIMATHRSAPNFVTSKRVEGRTVVLLPNQQISHRSKERWCASKTPILATMDIYEGNFWVDHEVCGANSHMAIRCGELGIPAAIGCGEELFSRLSGWCRDSGLFASRH